MIEIHLLEQLKALYTYGTLSAAAENLHIAQPSVSRAMKKLEEQLGVTLFERQKNKITLNETGKLAAEYAIKIIDNETEMEHNVRAFDRSLHTVNIGSCAPGPLMVLLPQMTGIFSDMTVSSDMADERALISGLDSKKYTAVILTRPLTDPKYYCRIYLSEQLYLSVTKFHPAAAYRKISFKEVDGQNFIMYASVGFWENVVREKMPNAKFFKQENLDAVSEIARSSDLLSFSTDITQKIYSERRMERANIPFSDPEAFAQYYIVCLKENKNRLAGMFRVLGD
jgi:DNA-binding transcriptional LysR family regulator